MPHSPKGETEQDLRLVYFFVVVVEVIVVASLYWLGKVFS
jgi:hypothetical protein